MTILLVMLGGGIGAVLRAWITNYCNARFTSVIPIPTTIVNLVGSFMIGLIMGLSLTNDWTSPFLVVGILGGLTTFSTLSSELVNMLTPQFKLVPFICYSLIQFVVGFMACYLGFLI